MIQTKYVTAKQVALVAAADDMTRERWACLLNCFEWPSDFPWPKPDWWDSSTRREKYDDEGQAELVNLLWRIAPNWKAYWRGPFGCGRNLERLQAAHRPKEPAV